MKSRRNQLVLLTGLLLVLAYFAYDWVRPKTPVAATSAIDQTFRPLAVENPALRVDLLADLKKLEYQGTGRNIFSAAPPPPPAPSPAALAAAAAAAAKAAPPAGPPPPPPLTVPATFFGYVTDAQTGTRRAFFSEGDDVYVVGVGDLLLGRFRLVQISNSTAELEETASGRRTTMTMTEPGSS